MKASSRRERIGAIAILGAAAFAIMAVVALTVSRAQLQSPSVWPMFQHDPAHSGQSQFDTSANPGLEKWQFETSLGNPIFDSAAIDADGTFTSALVSTLICLPASSTR
jgi:hypothetical protein